MIPENLEQAVKRLGTLCQADQRVVVAFVGGSLSTDSADKYCEGALVGWCAGCSWFHGFLKDSQR